ncbi:hypothetical protein VSR68_30210 [Paraburkholderia phymatum]|uniref:hypothetical protein n=1 Tax=Paraburkholderia phymatum TaxID=148447 RepID=UPI003174CFDD
MDQTSTNMTAPILCGDSTVLFSVYGFGWGYCAFSLPCEVVCEKLGAANRTPRQLMLAFELGKRRLLEAAQAKAVHGMGGRIPLSATDL